MVFISMIVIPSVLSIYGRTKNDIIEIANNDKTTNVYCDGELIESGKNIDLTKYKIIDIEYKDGQINVYVEVNE